MSRPLCKHKFLPYGSYWEKVSDNRYRTHHVWKCTKCGRLVDGDRLNVSKKQ